VAQDAGMRVRLAIGATTLLLLTAVAAGWMVPRTGSRSEHAPAEPPSAAVPAAMPTLAFVATAEPRPVRHAASAPRQAEHEPFLLHLFSAKGDARPFVLEAWQRPEMGGRRYASRVAGRCIGLRDQGPANDSEVAARVSEADLGLALEAFKFLQGRCGQFTDDELVGHSVAALVRNEDGRPDAASQLSDRVREAAEGSAERRRALKAVLDWRDPLLLDELGPHIALHYDVEGIYLFFRGQRYLLSEDPPLLGAFYLLPCAFGMPCGDTDMDLAAQCVAGTGCYKNRFERARAEIANDPQRYQALMRAYEDLAAAIRAGDVDAFMPQP
jgi:hypothetical protein